MLKELVRIEENDKIKILHNYGANTLPKKKIYTRMLLQFFCKFFKFFCKKKDLELIQCLREFVSCLFLFLSRYQIIHILLEIFNTFIRKFSKSVIAEVLCEFILIFSVLTVRLVTFQNKEVKKTRQISFLTFFAPFDGKWFSGDFFANYFTKKTKKPTLIYEA